MNRIAIVREIGSGKSYVAKLMGLPIFNAYSVVNKIYNTNYKCYVKIKKKIPRFIKSFPINTEEILKDIFADIKNLKEISDVVHLIGRSNMLIFVRKIK
jgi:Dephospho-CoA kinase